MSNFDDVKIFMKTYGQEVNTKPSFPDDKIVQLRYDLIKEELDELSTAINDKDITGPIVKTYIPHPNGI